MSLTPASMSADIVTALKGMGGAVAGCSDDQIKAFADALAKAIVENIQANAVATGTCPPTGGALVGGKVV